MSEEETWNQLANAIIFKAVEDWRYLCERLKKGKTQNANMFVSFKSLRRFFKSEWCAFLCGNLDPMLILNRLERERKDAINTYKTGGN